LVFEITITRTLGRSQRSSQDATLIESATANDDGARLAGRRAEDAAAART